MRLFLLLVLLVMPTACATKAEPAAPAAPAARGGAAGAAGEAKAQPYATAIAGLTTDTGVFKVHSSGDKVLYEIPVAQLGQPFLWVSTIAQTQEGTGFGGDAVADLVVHWERKGDRILLRERSFGIVAPDSIAMSFGVEAATLPRVIRAFKIISTSPDSAPVIDVTELFTREVPEISPRRRVGRVRRLDPDRSFLERVSVFPTNVNVEAMLTFEMETPSTASFFQRPPETVTTLVHHSMVKLPDDPMMPRIADHRVGYFTVGMRDYSRAASIEENTSYAVRYITRWRLEKKDPSAAVSEPVKPIVYYLAREIPERFREYIRAGVESWQPAFEAAGFRNAIIALDAPTPEEDPEWSAEDARVSSIRWQPTEATNAMGPHVHDPRTGEILESDIIFHAGLLDRYRAMYIVQVGAGMPGDMAIVNGQLPDSIEGEVLRSVTAHEVGHALGLQHNMAASDAYPVDSLRSGSFTRRFGVSASIMDYTRFNYVAQPGDDALRVRILGPYDHFAIMWGYTPIPDAGEPEDELATLDRWAARTATDRTIQFSSDPNNARMLTEDLGDDPVLATTYGLQNINRSFLHLREALAVPGASFENLEYMYGQLLSQRDRMFMHVARQIGGSRWESLTYGQPGTVYRPIGEAEQRRALEFLNEEALGAPAELSDPATLRLFDPLGGAEEVMERQRRLVSALLDPRRIIAMSALDATARDSENVYTHTEYLRDLRGLLFAELRQSRVEVDAYRRSAQRAAVARAAELVSAEDTHGEARAVLRQELTEISRLASQALPRSADAATRAHLALLVADAREALEVE